MLIFLILAPFGTISLLMLVSPPAVSLFAAAAVGLAVIAYDIAGGRAVKLLGAGSAILFVALGLYLMLVDSGWSGSAVKLTVDAGTLAISLVSMAIGRPFTMQYAHEVVDAETARLPGFLKANYVITGAWTAAFALMLMANVLMIYAPSLPLWTGLLIAFAARNSASYFTKWYPAYRKAKYGALTPAAAA